MDYTEEVIGGEVVRRYADGSETRFPVPEDPAPEETPVAPGRVKSKNEFLDMFTLDELSSFLTTARADPVVAAAKLRFDATSQVDLDNQATQQFLGLLAQKGVLTDARVAEILGGGA